MNCADSHNEESYRRILKGKGEKTIVINDCAERRIKLIDFLQSGKKTVANVVQV